MTERNQCTRCGGPLPDETLLAGHCPRCLLGVGLNPTTGLSEDTDVTNAAGGGSIGPARSTLPAAVGRYKILRLIGEGGMGAVYEAEQKQPRRTVALKVIKPGLASPELLFRFEQEAQALGRLQHPGIAQIYEAGTADAGVGPQPYFAMEFIQGKTLREYADQHRLNTRDRLEIMAKVADAVHHAHQRGLIHRDLKPGNIMVDETGQPKILDFGVARVTDSDAQALMQTDIGQLVGTLAYMSPEQVLGDPLELDTRSDVYALGVILYELLASKLPYEISKKIHEALFAIREEDPARLSSINRIYRGDIETITAKALEKDKTRRYSSAVELSADIRRCLNDEPIVARPTSASYQLQKFARRHKTLVMGVVAVFVVLVGGVVVSTSQMIRARRAEAEAAEKGNNALVQRDRAETAQKLAREERDAAVAARQLATSERQRAVSAEAIARQETAAAKEQRLLTLWGSLARESVRDSELRVDDDRASLLARQAMLFHARTPKQAQYLVEDALQVASRLEARSRSLLQQTVRSVAVSPDGTRLAGGSDDSLRIWDLRNPGAPPVLFPGNAKAVAFSPDGVHIATGSTDDLVRVWDLRNPAAPPVLFRGVTTQTNAVAFSPDGRRLAAGGPDGSVRIWDPQNPGYSTVLPSIRGGGAVLAMTFSPDSAWFAAAYLLGGVRVWNLGQIDKEPLRLDPFGFARSIAFSPDSALLAAGTEQGDLWVWDLRKPNDIAQGFGPQRGISAVAFSPDGSHIVAGAMDDLRLWDLRNPGAPSIVLDSKSPTSAIAYAPNGARLFVGGGDGLRVLELPSTVGQSMLVKNPQGTPTTFASFSPDGSYWAAGNGGTLEVWDLRNVSAAPIALRGPTGVSEGLTVAFSSDGARLASNDQDVGRLWLWDLRNPTSSPTSVRGHRGFVLALAFSPDGTLLASGSEESFRLSNVRDLNASPVSIGRGSFLFSALAFSPNGSRLVYADIDGLRLWDSRNPGAQLTVIPGSQGLSTVSIAFSPDGSRVATIGLEGGVRVFDLRNLPGPPVLLSQGRQETIGPTGRLEFLAKRGRGFVVFSPDGSRIAASGADNVVRLWDLRNLAAPPVLLEGHEANVTSLAFSRDGARLLASGTDNSVREWKLWSAAADYLCTRVWRNLSMEEWRLYVGEGIPYERTCPELPPGVGAPLAPK